MHRVALASATILLAAGTLLTGCGSDAPAGASTTTPAATAPAAPAATATGAETAAQAVSQAYATLRAGSYASSGSTTQTVDASGVDASLRDQVERQFAAEAATVSTRTRFESPERVAITQDIGGRSQQVVLYDGEVFVTADGTTWARVTGDAAAAFSQASSVAGLDPASLFSDLRADGTATIDGSPATRYSGTVDTTAAGEAVRAAIGGLGEIGSAVGDAVQLRSGTVELQVADSTGTVARQDVTMEIAFDLDVLARAAGEGGNETTGEGGAGGLGTIVMTSTGSETITDVGGDIVVRKPTATTTVSSVLGLGEFLAS